MNIYKKVCGSDADEKFMNLLLLASLLVSTEVKETREIEGNQHSTPIFGYISYVSIDFLRTRL